MTKQELAKHIAAFCEEHGDEETSKILSRALLGTAIKLGADELAFTDGDEGDVIVTPKIVTTRSIH